MPDHADEGPDLPPPPPAHADALTRLAFWLIHHIRWHRSQDQAQPDAEGHVTLPANGSAHRFASWAGLGREAAVKAFSTMRMLGIVTTTRRTIVIADMNTLARLASVDPVTLDPLPPDGPED